MGVSQNKSTPIISSGDIPNSMRWATPEPIWAETPKLSAFGGKHELFLWCPFSNPPKNKNTHTKKKHARTNKTRRVVTFGPFWPRPGAPARCATGRAPGAAVGSARRASVASRVVGREPSPQETSPRAARLFASGGSFWLPFKHQPTTWACLQFLDPLPEKSKKKRFGVPLGFPLKHLGFV